LFFFFHRYHQLLFRRGITYHLSNANLFVIISLKYRSIKFHHWFFFFNVYKQYFIWQRCTRNRINMELKKKKPEQGDIRYLTRALLVTGWIFFLTK
jgi:hypothetical protein